METAELTKTEQTHVERMSEPFSEPSMQENFESWAARSISHSKQEKKEKEKHSGPREIKLAGRSEEEKDFIEKVAQQDESKDSAKESRRDGSTEKEATARTEQQPSAKENEKPAVGESDDSPSEPLSGDLAERHWQGKLQGPEIENHIQQVNSRAGIIMKYINQHPQKAQIADGFRAIFAGRPPAEYQAFFRDLTTALAEVPDPGRVFQHITLQPHDREFLRNVKNPKDLRAAIQTIAKQYPASAPQASPKPRAPKPPSEVGGRGAVGDDGTRGDGDFSSFSAKMNQRYRR
jgi:hypothetical protein